VRENGLCPRPDPDLVLERAVRTTRHAASA
jgi:hypothetical protein